MLNTSIYFIYCTTQNKTNVERVELIRWSNYVFFQKSVLFTRVHQQESRSANWRTVLDIHCLPDETQCRVSLKRSNNSYFNIRAVSTWLATLRILFKINTFRWPALRDSLFPPSLRISMYLFFDDLFTHYTFNITHNEKLIFTKLRRVLLILLPSWILRLMHGINYFCHEIQVFIIKVKS